MSSALESSNPAFSRRVFRRLEREPGRNAGLGTPHVCGRGCNHGVAAVPASDAALSGPLLSGMQAAEAEAQQVSVPRRAGLVPGLDRLGIWLSAGCAVHCAVTPVLLLVAPVLGTALFENTLRLVLVSLGIGAVAWGIVYHRSPRALPWLLGAVGLFGWLIFHHETPHEAALSVFASLLLIGAHWTNLRVARH